MQQEQNSQRRVLPECLTIKNISELYHELKELGAHHRVELDFGQVTQFDTAAIGLINYLKRLAVDITFKNVSEELQKRFSMFPLIAVPEVAAKTRPTRFFHQHIAALGQMALNNIQQMKTFLILLTDELVYVWQYLLKRRGVYPGEVLQQIYFMGYKSFPIVTLISFLVGITISITSAQQLHNFGADVYLADLVGFGMIRELVPLMTGIILAGKIGAAVTAEIASMKVLEETDALKTMGIIPEKFLMVPRLIAITLTIPLLVAIADFVGIFAGVLVARVVLDIPPTMFFTEMFTVVAIGDFLIGLLKTAVFGGLLWLVVVTKDSQSSGELQG